MRIGRRRMVMALCGTVLLAAVLGGTTVHGRGQEARPRVDESVEPPMLFTLEIGGKRHAIEIDRPLVIPTEQGKTVVVLRGPDHRVFACAGIRFRYPARFGFEAGLADPASSIWTLDGSDVVLMIQRFAGRKDHEACRREIARGTALQLGIRRPETRETKTMLGGREIPGTHVVLAIGEVNLSMEFHSLTVGGDTVLLVVQDGLGDDGRHTEEWESTMEMLTRSFELTGSRK